MKYILVLIMLNFFMQFVSAQTLLISGSIESPDVAVLDNIYHISSEEDIPNPDAEYYAEFFDKTGKMIRYFDFDTFSEEYPRYFVFSVNVDGEVWRVDIRNHEKLIKNMIVSPNAPVVSSVTLEGNKLSWTANDIDNNNLLYDLYYKCDFGEWKLILNEFDEIAYNIDFSKLDGGNSCFLKVVANDGYNEAESVSQEFSVADKLTEVGIIFPNKNSEFSTNFLNDLGFYGYVYDLEESVVDSEFEWVSNKDGIIGNEIYINAISLSLGEHVITFNVKNIDGNLIGSDSISIFVSDKTEPDSFITSLIFNAEKIIKGNETIIITDIKNTITDNYANINFYDGNPDSGGTLILTREIYIPANFDVKISATWIPQTAGDKEIYVKLDNFEKGDNNLSNNIMKKDIRVFPKTSTDANGDDRVNILDLIFVRNKLNANVIAGDNWQADTNGDGKINILDMIAIRNKLNANLGILSLII